MENRCYYLNINFNHEVKNLSKEAVALPFEGKDYIGGALMNIRDLEVPSIIYMKVNLNEVKEIDYPLNDIGPLLSKRMYSIFEKRGLKHITIPVIMLDEKYKGGYFDAEGKLKSDVKTNTEFVIIQMKEYADVFDYKHSVYYEDTMFPGDVGLIKTLVLEESKDGFPPIFRIGENMRHLFINAETKEALESAGITGCTFRPAEVTPYTGEPRDKTPHFHTEQKPEIPHPKTNSQIKAENEDVYIKKLLLDSEQVLTAISGLELECMKGVGSVEKIDLLKGQKAEIEKLLQKVQELEPDFKRNYYPLSFSPTNRKELMELCGKLESLLEECRGKIINTEVPVEKHTYKVLLESANPADYFTGLNTEGEKLIDFELNTECQHLNWGDMPLFQIAESDLTMYGIAKHCPNLKVLQLYGAELVYDDLTAFQYKDMLNLKVLDLSENELEKLPFALGDLSALEYLSLGKNPLKTLPESISNLKKLKYLDLSNTHLSKDEIEKLREELPSVKIVF